jgi:hypothetical protein
VSQLRGAIQQQSAGYKDNIEEFVDTIEEFVYTAFFSK